ncbi:MAG: hypothetical protein QF437_27950, partial [Planctomycetota bacterium]|nr:hypothetical protein [Planctomycetota bacterium]
MNLSKILVTATLVVFSAVAWQRFLPFKGLLNGSADGDSESVDDPAATGISFNPTVSERRLQLTTRDEESADAEPKAAAAVVEEGNPEEGEETEKGEIEEGQVVPVEKGDSDSASSEPAERSEEEAEVQTVDAEDAAGAEVQKPAEVVTAAADTASAIPAESTTTEVVVNPPAVEDKAAAPGATARATTSPHVPISRPAGATCRPACGGARGKAAGRLPTIAPGRRRR